MFKLANRALALKSCPAAETGRRGGGGGSEGGGGGGCGCSVDVTLAIEFAAGLVDPDVVTDGLMSAAIEKRLEPSGFFTFVWCADGEVGVDGVAAEIAVLSSMLLNQTSAPKFKI